MLDSWERPSTGRSDIPREFLVSAELYVSLAAGASLRKPINQWKKSDRRDSARPTSGASEDKKVKEKSSWLALARGPAGSDQWRSATCKLSEEGERCLLNIYVDESILYQTIYIHLLHHTDIRQADNSLFCRKQCLGIYCIAGQRWTSTHTAEPVYLHFPNSDACNTWLSLLRSYAIPEIYGRWVFPEDGGSYRMWRQVELTIIQGRNLGYSKPFESNGNANGMELAMDSDVVDIDVSCEVNLNDIACGRTTVKKGIGSPEWHEAFVFSDLPPFDTLAIVVWREKKLFKPAILGSIRVALGNFRRGETVDGWFPVLHGGTTVNDVQVGEIRLKIRVDEEIILPYSAYSKLLKTFNSRNFLDWMTEFEMKLRLKTISTHLMSIAVARGVLIEQVQELAFKEVDGSTSSHQTLFRGNTILTKVMELCMAWYGKAFLEASIGSVLRRLCAEKVAIEVDPLRSGKGTKDVERNVEQLIYWCQEFWNQIYSVREECPNEIRRLFETIRQLVEQRYRPQGPLQEQNKHLPWQSVSAFCFLRFIVPAILHPHLFGLCPGLPSVPVQRSLTLIAKVIQSLANLNASVQKEDFMRGVKDFLRDRVPAMIEYLDLVSSPANDPGSLYPRATDRHDRLNVVNSLRQRERTMPVLDREAIPLLPHLLDIPRHLAIITSAVIRNSRGFCSNDSSDPGDQVLKDFCSQCFEVEEHALLRVSQLATKISSDRRPLASASWTQVSTPPVSPDHSMSFPVFSPTPKRRPHKSSRPSTAPSSSETDTSRRRMFATSSLMPHPTPDIVRQPPDQRGPQHRTRLPSHTRSTSTECVPSFGVVSPSELMRPLQTVTDISDDARKRKKGLLRGILRR
ncbi:Rho GTPase activation protein [Infundibulicybe gibba]|nr:Rho GTPase activation protein [Infundibulicybe gibba]